MSDRIWRTAYRLVGPGRARGLRVTALVLAVALMSGADLYFTLTYIKGAGMVEANPLARGIMQYQCAWLLGAWKVVLTCLTCAILVGTRQRWTAEAAAWTCCVIMVWLMLRWHTYADHVTLLTPVMHEVVEAEKESGKWVQF